MIFDEQTISMLMFILLISRCDRELLQALRTDGYEISDVRVIMNDVCYPKVPLSYFFSTQILPPGANMLLDED